MQHKVGTGKLKSKLSAKAFHNHFPGLWSSGVKSLAKDLPSECNRCCTHVMLQELTRGPTFGSAKHPNASVKAARAQYSKKTMCNLKQTYQEQTFDDCSTLLQKAMATCPASTCSLPCLHRVFHPVFEQCLRQTGLFLEFLTVSSLEQKHFLLLLLILDCSIHQDTGGQVGLRGC